MFLLGLRHGLDPDHIACIDGLTWRALDAPDHSSQRVRETETGQDATGMHQARASKLAPWVGTLFALGHGLLVTVIAVGIHQISRHIHVPEAAVTIFGWIPTLLLLLVGVINLTQLLDRGRNYSPTGWKTKLLPKGLQHASSPLAIVAIGVLFATVFDTATQAAAWGYVATSHGGIAGAAAAGLVFTVGMMITDTVDGRLLCHIVHRSGGREASQRYRRVTGWLIVVLSFGVAAYNLLKAWVPAMELDESAYSLVGGALVMCLFVLAAALHRTHLSRTRS